MKPLILSLITLMAMSLISCTSMNSNLDCPNKAGVNCKSLDQINAMVDGGMTMSQSHTVSPPSSNDETFQPYPSLSAYYSGAPIRYGETVQRVWIAPYEDTDGNFHQDSMIYVIMKNGHWIGTPIHEIKLV